ncbi:MAG: hypothetical protein K8S99_00750 [Planctomycetes bacterium]|nr:hypothetical protein [Planctomycetota bacterium]
MAANPSNLELRRKVEGAKAKPVDPELAAIILAWPALPPAIRIGILAMIKAAAQ